MTSLTLNLLGSQSRIDSFPGLPYPIFNSRSKPVANPCDILDILAGENSPLSPFIHFTTFTASCESPINCAHSPMKIFQRHLRRPSLDSLGTVQDLETLLTKLPSQYRITQADDILPPRTELKARPTFERRKQRSNTSNWKVMNPSTFARHNAVMDSQGEIPIIHRKSKFLT